MLKAALIPGIQDEPKDWKALEEACSDFLEITRIRRPRYRREYDDNRRWKSWTGKVVKECRNQISTKQYDLLIGHSGGCKRVLDLIGNEHLPKTAVLFNPPRTKIEKGKVPDLRKIREQRNRERAKHKDKVPTRESVGMLLPLITNLPEEIWIPMVIRHGKHSLNGSVNRSRMITELKLHGKTREIADVIAEVDEEIHLLVLDAENDPWFAPIEERDNVKVHTDPEAGHYGLHMWKVQETSQRIRDFCKRMGLIL